MKTVFNNDQLPHIFAQQNQNHGRNSGGSFYFNGNIIYSYGQHFPIARILPDDVALITTQSYSVTTAAHISRTYAALSHYKSFSVNNVLADTKPEHRDNLKGIIASYQDALLSAGRARTYKQIHIDRADRLYSQAVAYSKAFKLGANIKRQDITELLEAAKKQAKKDKAKRERLAKQRERLAKQNAAKYAAQLEQWKAGQRDSIERLQHNAPVWMRLSDDKKTVQTTKGASFPAKECSAVWRIVQLCRKRAAGWKPEPGQQVKLGHFRINSISANGQVIAGCHTVDYPAIKELAGILGL